MTLTFLKWLIKTLRHDIELHAVCRPVAKMDYSHPSDVQDCMEGCMGRRGQSSLSQLSALCNSPPTEIKESRPVNQMLR